MLRLTFCSPPVKKKKKGGSGGLVDKDLWLESHKFESL